MSSMNVGQILGIALRTAARGPMREVSILEVAHDGTLSGDHRASGKRAITFLSSVQWRAVQQELQVELPWHTRRANLLVECDSLENLVGQTVRAGSVEVAILGETDPCARMEELHPGLREALVPHMRGGVHGRVTKGGTIQIGDPLVQL